MSREEAIADIRDNIKPVVGGKSLDMAIEALEKINKIDKIAHIRSIEDLNGLNCEEAILGLFKTVLEENPIEKQEPCTDAINRQAVLDLPRIKTHNHWGNVIKESVDIEDVRQLPSVTPAEKVGKWKRISMDKYSEHAKYWYRCDRCGEDNLGNTNYCPNCGQRKMQEVEE